MPQLKIVECKGYTKEEAFSELDFMPNRPSVKGRNATASWVKEGKPLPGTYAFKNFAIQQLSEKTRNEPGVGLHIVIDAPVQDTRKRPYTVVNVMPERTREWRFVYWIREDDLDVSNLPEVKEDEDGEMVATTNTIQNVDVAKMGKVIAQCNSKADAFKLIKELTSKNKRSYSMLAIKVPDVAPIAAYSIYTPSAGAKEGTFIAFGYNND